MPQDIHEGRVLIWDPKDAERFDGYVVFTDDHWLWIGYVDPIDGYGRLKVKGNVERTHRLAYSRWVGPLEEDETGDRMVVDHLCHERRCVRPEHLKLVTYRENAANADTPIARNIEKTECDHGHPFTPENTYLMPGGGRACKTCRRDWIREYRARRKAQGTSAAAPATRSA